MCCETIVLRITKGISQALTGTVFLSVASVDTQIYEIVPALASPERGT